MFYLFFPLLASLESIRKVLDKQAVKFVRAIKQDTRSGKTEDRILVSDTNTLHTLHTLPPCPRMLSHQVTCERYLLLKRRRPCRLNMG